jgi:hypothetical protein
VPTCQVRSWYLTPKPEVLSERSHVAEILWNFCRLKGKERLRLSQNPQFYAPFPKFTNQFREEPTEYFQVEKVYVLTDNPSRRVYLETARNRRAFGNVWSLNKVIIFKGSRISNQFFFSLFPFLTSSQTSVEILRARESSGRPFMTRSTLGYGALRSLRDLVPPRGHIRQIGAIPHQPRPQRQYLR